ncbi:MAG TPA: uroporphyrinogen decarboxylase [Nitrospiria bacterium]|jgi:uroporphyrinogen decarboxylase
MLKNELFLKACRREGVDQTPVWIMRQAGRYMKEYRELRKKVDFLTLCKTPELALEASMLPVEILKIDAAILFSDILIPVEAMGMDLSFTDSGPVLGNPIQNEEQVESLTVPLVEEKLFFVFDAIRLIQKTLEGRLPLLGFSGAPYTLATYMVEGRTSSNFYKIKKLLFSRPDLVHTLFKKLTETVTRYLQLQIRAGVQAVQLFDTWAGTLSPETYREFALPYTQQIVESLRPEGVPIILYVNGGGGLLELMAGSGVDVVSIDWRVDIKEAKERIGSRVCLQGNLDPCFLYGNPANIRREVKRILEGFGRGNGHIFNLGHGILPDTPVENAIALVEAVHEESRCFH